MVTGMLAAFCCSSVLRVLCSKREKGTVTVAILVNYDGTVKATSLLSGDPVRGEAAMGAIKQWEFRPYVLNGQRVQVESRVVMNFW